MYWIKFLKINKRAFSSPESFMESTQSLFLVIWCEIMLKENDSIRHKFLLLFHWSDFWIIWEAASSGHKEKRGSSKHFFCVSFFLSSNMKSYLGDVVTNCSEYLWLHKHINAVDRNLVSFVPTTPISLYNNFLRYFFRLGKQNTLQWLHTSNNNSN